MRATGFAFKAALTATVACASFAWSAAATSITFTNEELAEINSRMQMARGIVDQLRPQAVVDRYSPGWDLSLMGRLLNQSSTDLAEIKSVRTMDDVNAALGTGRANRAVQKTHGFATNNLVFHTISPCRLLDTRNAIGILPANTTRSMNMNNSDTSGGTTGCSTTIENADPVIGTNTGWGALALNATVANTAAGPAFLRLRPAGSTNASAWLNWIPANAQVANAGILALDGTGNFEMFASSTTDVIIDVFGAFGKTRQLSCSEVVNPTNWTVAPDNFVQLLDSDIIACPAGTVHVGYVWNFVSGSGGLAPWQNGQTGTTGGGFVLGFTHVRPTAASAGSTITFTPGRTCCRIPDVSQ